MELGYRSFRIVSRILRRPIHISTCRNVSGLVNKEDVNTELLNSYNQDIKAGGAVPVFRRALLFPSRVALEDELGTYTYAGLYQAASALSKQITAQLGGDTQRTVSYLCKNDSSHVIVQWAIWMSGNIAVPLTPLHPPEMLKYFLEDSMSGLLICTQDYEKLLHPIAKEKSVSLFVMGKESSPSAKVEGELSEVGNPNAWYGESDALIIYTSGTTSLPKGVVWTHSMLQTQISALHAAWQYSANDVVLHTLPLHHIHGQLNSVNASLATGASIQMMSFNERSVWSRLVGSAGGLDEESPKREIPSVIHGVPAMYWRLVRGHEQLFPTPSLKQQVREHLQKRLRLAAVGSAPLPDALAHKWTEISGVPLLERYGMSEVGMALSNPYRPVERRAVGAVGAPLPGVAARIAAPAPELTPLLTVTSDMTSMQIPLERIIRGDGALEEDKNEWHAPHVTQHQPSDNQGELLLKGPAVFKRYWNRQPKPDNSDFTSDGWFRTGDMASYTDGNFKIMGRTSVDIIKSSGYKISALQVESAILDHAAVADVAVIGVEHETKGESVAALVVLKENASLTLKDIKEFASKKLSPYQLPRILKVVKELPRNTMGKLDKKEIKKLYGKQLVEKK